MTFVLSLVEAHGFLVERRSFLARNKSFQLKVLSRLHECFVPFVQTVAFVSALSCGVGFLGNDLSAFVLHQIFFGLTGGLDFFLGASEHLRPGSADRFASSLSSAADDTASPGSSALTRNASSSSASSTTTTSSHVS
eukprot:UN28204